MCDLRASYETQKVYLEKGKPVYHIKHARSQQHGALRSINPKHRFPLDFRRSPQAVKPLEES